MSIGRPTVDEIRQKEGPDTLRVEAEEVAPLRPIILGTTSRVSTDQ
jgi:hypothetical protein